MGNKALELVAENIRLKKEIENLKAEIERHKAEIERLKEFEYMYKELCK